MTGKIFRSILLVAGTVLAASLLVIMGCLYEYFGGVEQKQLRDELELASAAVEESGKEYLAQMSSDHYRLTWIAGDGTVLCDTVIIPSLSVSYCHAEFSSSQVNETT